MTRVAQRSDRPAPSHPSPTLAGRLVEGVHRASTVDGLRVVLVVCQAAMILQTWPLWRPRGDPPNLPVAGWLPQLDLGWLLLATLVLVLVRPPVGLVVHAAVLAFALATDQIRLQPEWISVALLLVATGPWRHARTLGWAHLSSLWLWAGLSKFSSTGFAAGTAAFVAGDIGLGSHPGLLRWGLPAFELGIGVAAAVPAVRRVAGLGGFALHVASIPALGMEWWWAILPWNIALAWSALVLLALGRWRQPEVRPRDDHRQPAATAPSAARVALITVVFAYPALAYTGAVDLYLAHHLFSDDWATATVCEPDGRCDPFPVNIAGARLKAPIPPERRLYQQWFREVCQPGQTLVVTGRRLRPPLDRTYGTDDSRLACPRTA